MVGGNCSLKPETKTTVENLTEKLVIQSQVLTRSSRDWMGENPNKPLPEDYSKFPGKMDHATCVSIKIQSHAD